MPAHTVSLINAVVLIAFSVWGYLSYADPSITALIPAVFGLLLLILNPSVKKQNKVVAHIAVVLTILVLGGLFRPLTGAIERDNTLAIIRVLGMMLTTIWALIAFVQSFTQARKKKSA